MKLKKLSFFFFAITALVLLLAATSLCVSAETVAYPVNGGNIYFNTATGTITGSDKYVTSADIPDTINGVKVKKIGPVAFTKKTNSYDIIYSNTYLVSVQLPDTITSIGDFAFSGCSNLKTINIPENLTFLGLCAFEYCSSLESPIVIPGTVSEIPTHTFVRCKKIPSVTIMDGVTRIGDDSFWNCRALTSIIIPKSVEYIGTSDWGYKNLFDQCSELTIYYRGSKEEWEALPNTELITQKVIFDFGCTKLDGHKYSDWTETKTPNCNEPGSKERICEYCNHLDIVELPIVHVWGEWFTAVAPGCGTDGKNVRACTLCETTDAQTIPATGIHTWSEWMQSTAPTCVKDGEKTRSCSVCNTTETQSIPATGEHSWSVWGVSVAPTVNSEGKEVRLCTVCNTTESRTIPAICDHTFGEWSVTVDPTCEVPGEEQRSCVNCNASESREIEPIDHTEVHVEAKEPTCADYGNVEYYYCSVCGYHRTPDGMNTNRLQVILPPTELHVWEEWIVTVEPTCQQAGVESSDCKNCGLNNERYINVTVDHDFNEWSIAEEATCVAEGSEIRICQVCGEYETHTIPATGEHIFGDWTITVEPTAFEVGERSRKCENCDHTETEGLAKLDMTNPFTDVKEGKWYTEGVLYCYHKGYMAGVSEDVFGYKQNVTRAMFVTILAKIDGADTSSYTETSFSDVKAGQWYSASIEWAYKNGYAAGIGDKVFGYKENVSREQIAMFLYTYSAKNGIDVSAEADLSAYVDHSRIHSWALDALEWAVSEALISGTSDTTLSPRDSATRAEIALIVMNYVENIKTSGI